MITWKVIYVYYIESNNFLSFVVVFVLCCNKIHLISFYKTCFANKDNEKHIYTYTFSLHRTHFVVLPYKAASHWPPGEIKSYTYTLDFSHFWSLYNKKNFLYKFFSIPKIVAGTRGTHIGVRYIPDGWLLQSQDHWWRDCKSRGRTNIICLWVIF